MVTAAVVCDGNGVTILFPLLPVITRFQYTQDESLYNQLSYGIRYLDFRLGAYNESKLLQNGTVHFDEELWLVHDIEQNHINLTNAMSQIRRFMEETKYEIVIADFHRFVNGFIDVSDVDALNRRLKLFHSVILEQLGDYLIPYR